MTRVSVIVAARNEARRLPECLASLKAQTYTPLDILVADDGSTDGTAAVAERLGVRALRLPPRGKATTLNDAVQSADGEIVAFLDADQVFAPNFVAELVGPIVTGRAVGTTHGTELVANPDNRWSRCWQALAGLPAERRLAVTDPDAPGSTVFRALRRADFLRVGGFTPTGYDDDQTLAAKLDARARWVPEAVCRHYNVETLGEVFGLGTWGGRTEALRAGPRILLSGLPPFAVLRALRAARRHRSWWLVPYLLVHDTGRWWGACRALVFRESGRGR